MRRAGSSVRAILAAMTRRSRSASSTGTPCSRFQAPTAPVTSMRCKKSSTSARSMASILPRYSSNSVIV